jgi:hypothetical protein
MQVLGRYTRRYVFLIFATQPHWNTFDMQTRNNWMPE